MTSRVVVTKLVSYDQDYIGDIDEIFMVDSNLRISDGVSKGGLPLDLNNLSITSSISESSTQIVSFGKSELFLPIDTTTNEVLIKLDDTYLEGQKIIIKDIVGNAGINKITVQSIHNIDQETQVTININYGSITLIFNNSTWSII